MPLKSKISIARPNSKSLRATIPEGIVEFLNLQPSDTLEWEMQTTQDERTVTVKKAEIRSPKIPLDRNVKSEIYSRRELAGA